MNAPNVLCAQLTHDLFAIAKFLFNLSFISSSDIFIHEKKGINKNKAQRIVGIGIGISQLHGRLRRKKKGVKR